MEMVQVIGTTEAFLNPDAKPVTRLATLADVEDDCPLCQQLREQIEAGNPPMVMVYE